MTNYKMLDGNAAVAEAMKAARVKVIAAYPITPQSPISEKLADLTADNTLDAKYIRVESEHSALSVVMGAQLTGVRTATATSSVGLALMHEIVNVVAGVRCPVVMGVVNRSLAAPWSLWCDHTDSMAERDSGWLQLYCENVQDAYDLMLCAYRIAEDRRVQTPAMVCQDGFFLSHSMQKVAVIDQGEIDVFVGEYAHKNAILDPADPLVACNLTPSSDYTEMRYQQKLGFDAAPSVAREVFDEFKSRFGRAHDMVEGYLLDDAELVFVSLGSMSGTAKYVVNQLRERGIRAGALKVVLYRPFPASEVAKALEGIERIAVMDRIGALGSVGGPLYQDVAASLLGQRKILKNYVAGLAGRDISPDTISAVFANLLASDSTSTSQIWIDLKDNPTKIREVECYV